MLSLCYISGDHQSRAEGRWTQWFHLPQLALYMTPSSTLLSTTQLQSGKKDSSPATKREGNYAEYNEVTTRVTRRTCCGQLDRYAIRASERGLECQRSADLRVSTNPECSPVHSMSMIIQMIFYTPIRKPEALQPNTYLFRFRYNIQ